MPTGKSNGGNPLGAKPIAPDYVVHLPAGGVLHLQSADEKQMWTQALERYMAEYIFRKMNDLINLGALLQQQVVLYRCQVRINGMEEELDSRGQPTGGYRRIDLDGSDLANYQKTLTESSKEIARLEKALGIDKVTREAGGAHTLDSYIRTLKQAAHERGIHVTDQVKEYQGLVKELGWKLRLLYKGDAQDRKYHDITPRTLLDWLYQEVQRLEEKDQEWSKTTGRLYVGKL